MHRMYLVNSTWLWRKIGNRQLYHISHAEGGALTNYAPTPQHLPTIEGAGRSATLAVDSHLPCLRVDQLTLMFYRNGATIIL
jgi:hypothetical protein